MSIKMSGIQYQLDGNGDTTGVLVSYQYYADMNNLSANVLISGENLDDMKKTDFDKAGRDILMKLIPKEEPTK